METLLKNKKSWEKATKQIVFQPNSSAHDDGNEKRMSQWALGGLGRAVQAALDLGSYPHFVGQWVCVCVCGTGFIIKWAP